tara:strand:+ start:435 stop:824 length:390 start_codon:yes stop_codon:yes gene_type:complete
MDNYIKEGSFSTPSVNLNATSGLLKLLGRSIPENPVKHYQPIEGWFKNFIQTSPSKITLQIHLDYLNTHSTECVLILMKILESYYKSSNADVKIIWNFDEDDDDIEDLGDDLSTLLDIPFETIEVLEKD